jgi:hypothetical protein
LRWSITYLSDVDQRGSETAVDKWLANEWWQCTAPATSLLLPVVLRKVAAGPAGMIISPAKSASSLRSRRYQVAVG